MGSDGSDRKGMGNLKFLLAENDRQSPPAVPGEKGESIGAPRIDATTADLAAQHEDADRLRKELAKTLEMLPDDSFCVVIGNSLRGMSFGNPYVDRFENTPEARSVVAAEVVRRKLRVNTPFIKAQKIRIGMSDCELRASWGWPQDKHVSTGPWGVHIQYIFGPYGPYVYVQNGRISAYQN